MQIYEIGYLILPSLPEEGVVAVLAKLKEAVTQAGGEEVDGEEPFKYDLAYTMSKTIGASRYVVSDAYLGWLKFELDPTKALELKAAVEKLDEILRFLLVKVPRDSTSTFTFAKAKALLAEKEAQEKAGAEKPEVSPVEEPVV